MKIKRSYIARFGTYLAKRDGGWVCHYCHTPLIAHKDKRKPVKHIHRKIQPQPATIDHKTALVNGGLDEPENMVLCCEDCNKDKGTTDYKTYWRSTAHKRQGESK